MTLGSTSSIPLIQLVDPKIMDPKIMDQGPVRRQETARRREEELRGERRAPRGLPLDRRGFGFWF